MNEKGRLEYDTLLRRLLLDEKARLVRSAEHYDALGPAESLAHVQTELCDVDAALAAMSDGRQAEALRAAPYAAGVPVGQEPVAYQVRPRSFPAGKGWRDVSKREFEDYGDTPGYPGLEWERRTLYTTPPAAQAVDLEQFRDVLEDVGSLGHHGSCRCWQYSAAEDRCDCGLTDAREKAAAAIVLIDAAMAAQPQGGEVDDA